MYGLGRSVSIHFNDLWIQWKMLQNGLMVSSTRSLDLNFTDDTSTMPTASIDTDAVIPDNMEKPDKIVYKLEPCDKVATLYVMQQKFEPPTYTDSIE